MHCPPQTRAPAHACLQLDGLVGEDKLEKPPSAAEEVSMNEKTVRFPFEKKHAQGVLVAVAQWLEEFALPGGKRNPQGTRIRLEFRPEDGFTQPALLSVETLWLRGADATFRHEEREVIVPVWKSPALFELYRADTDVRMALQSIHRQTRALHHIDRFNRRPSPLQQIPTAIAPAPTVEAHATALATMMAVLPEAQRWFDEAFSAFKAESSQEERGQIAEAVRPQAALLLMQNSLSRAALAETRKAPPKNDLHVAELAYNEGIISLTDIQLDFLLKILTHHCREAGLPDQPELPLDSRSLLTAMWRWFENHLPGETTQGDTLVEIPGMWSQIHAPDVFKFETTFRITYQGVLAAENYDGPQIQVKIPSAEDLRDVLKRDPHLRRSVLDLRGTAEKFLDTVMVSRDLPGSLLVQAQSQLREGGSLPPRFFLEHVDEIHAWYEVVRRVFQEQSSQDERGRGAKIFRPLVASAILSLCIRDEILRKPKDRLADASRPFGPGERESLEATVQTEEYQRGLLDQERELFFELLLKCMQQAQPWLDRLHESPIWAFLPEPMRKRFQRPRREQSPPPLVLPKQWRDQEIPAGDARLQTPRCQYMINELHAIPVLPEGLLGALGYIAFVTVAASGQAVVLAEHPVKGAIYAFYLYLPSPAGAGGEAIPVPAPEDLRGLKDAQLTKRSILDHGQEVGPHVYRRHSPLWECGWKYELPENRPTDVGHPLID